MGAQPFSQATSPGSLPLLPSCFPASFSPSSTLLLVGDAVLVSVQLSQAGEGALFFFFEGALLGARPWAALSLAS